MKIEAGKYYRTRDGRRVGPMEGAVGGWLVYPRIDNDEGIDWYEDGAYSVVHESPLDIIAEWPSLTPHQQRTADMIKVMQAYVDGEEVQWDAGKEYLSALTPNWSWGLYDYRIAPAGTPDTIDWSHVSPEFKYMARNINGTAYLHEAEPRLIPNSRWTSMASARVSHTSYHRGTCDWKDSLVKRPE